MSQLVITVPGDTANWGPVKNLLVSGNCLQSCSVMQNGKLVCILTVQWPTPLPQPPVLSQVTPRHGGEFD